METVLPSFVMTIDPKDLKEFKTLPFSNVRTRKHVFGTDYAILTVMQVRDGFEGNLGCTTLAINERVFEHGETMKECCDKLDRRFREIVPNHQCGSDCFGDWQPESAIFTEPTGKPQWRSSRRVTCVMPTSEPNRANLPL